jgi:hypothetical protein
MNANDDRERVQTIIDVVRPFGFADPRPHSSKRGSELFHDSIIFMQGPEPDRLTVRICSSTLALQAIGCGRQPSPECFLGEFEEVFAAWIKRQSTCG